VAIEDILKALEEQGQADAEEIMSVAREQAAQITSQAQLDANEILAVKRTKADYSASVHAERIENSARLDAKLALSTARGEEVLRVFEAAEVDLAHVRDHPGYADLFLALAGEALAGLEGSVLLRVAPGDEPLAEQAAHFARVSATVDPTLETAGGLVVEARSGRYARSNTVEARLDRAREQLFTDVAKVLFA
jgi:V/A-type H+-transporting ATPase subunit E